MSDKNGDLTEIVKTTSSKTNVLQHTQQPGAVLTLPDGRIIDGKNTLQSFDGIASHRSAGTANTPRTDSVQPALTLPDGRIINGKNTLQSFDVPKQPNVHDAPATTAPSTNPRNVGIGDRNMTPAVTSDDGNDPNHREISHHQDNNTTNAEDSAVQLEAVVVPSFAVVHAEIVNSRIDLLRRPMFWFTIVFAMMIVSAASVFGTLFGLGSERSEPVVRSQTPTEQLTIACDFLLLSSLTLCQTTTLFNTSIMGNAIPIEIGWLTQLTHLDLSNNTLTGPIPSTLESLTQLVYLALHNNQLSGTIVSELAGLTELTYLTLDNNLLSGTIPPLLGNLVQLSSIFLDNNQLIGSIPSSLGNLAQVHQMFLDHNNLTGSVPLTMGNLIQLQGFSLSENKLNGTIPSTLGNLAQLTVLGLGGNHLTGTIPSTFGNLTRLTSLNLYSNPLTGTIPSTMGNLMQLDYLYLYGNLQLGGTVPSMLCNLSNISVYIDCANDKIVCSCCRTYPSKNFCA